MSRAKDLDEAKTKLAEVAEMLEELNSRLSLLSEDQVLWVPPGGKEWPIQRSVAHCVNCEHRAITELRRAMRGKPTPETVPADTGIFAWFGPTPYLLARVVCELKDQVKAVCRRLDSSHLKIEAVRYPKHPPRKLLEYVEVMQGHTTRHLEAIRKRMERMPEGKEWDDDVRAVYPGFGLGDGR